MGGRFLIAVAPVALLAVAGCTTAAGPVDGGGVAESPRSASGSAAVDAGGVGEPPLIGTAWQLASSQESATAVPVRVRTDSTILFSADGGFSATTCNGIEGAARIEGHTITFGRWSTTLAGCGPYRPLEEAIEAAVTGSADWSIRGRTLTLTNRNGHILTYKVRPSTYPSLTAKTIAFGTRAGGRFRLAVDGPADHPSLVFETQTAPGKAWGRAGMAAPGPKDCLANSVLAVGHLGGDTFLAAWATPEIAKVTVRAAAGTPETRLTFYPVPDSTLRIAGRWITTFQPRKSPVTFYNRSGAAIAAYPNGPC